MNEQRTAYLAAKSIDVVQEFEDATGLSTRADMAQAEALRLLSVVFSHNAAKHQMLIDLGDTTFSNKLDRYIKIVERFGFKQQLCIDQVKVSQFKEDKGAETPEKLFVYTTDDGFFLVFDTYSYMTDGKFEVNVNSAKVYYALKSKSGTHPLCYKTGDLSSGGLESVSEPDWRRTHESGQFPDDLTWVGYHDAREGLISTLLNLREKFQVLATWPPTLRHQVSLRSYIDYDKTPWTEKEAHKELDRSRFEMLPEPIRKQFGFQGESE